MCFSEGMKEKVTTWPQSIAYANPWGQAQSEPWTKQEEMKNPGMLAAFLFSTSHSLSLWVSRLWLLCVYHQISCSFGV